MKLCLLSGPVVILGMGRFQGRDALEGTDLQIQTSAHNVPETGRPSVMKGLRLPSFSVVHILNLVLAGKEIDTRNLKTHTPEFYLLSSELPWEAQHLFQRFFKLL